MIDYEYTFPLVDEKNIKVIFKKKTSKNSTEEKRYEILDIVIYKNGTLEKWPEERYSTIN